MNDLRVRCVGFLVLLLTVSVVNAQSSLDSASGNWQEANLQVSLAGNSGGQVEIGQPLGFDVSSAASGYVVLAHINADGDLSLLFPGAPTQASGPNLAANSTLSFPDAGSNLALEAQLPLGNETLYAILSEAPITSASFGDPEGQIYIGQGRSVRLIDQLSQLIDTRKADGKVAIARMEYEITPLSGDVQFTTRAIERYFGDPPDTGEPAKEPKRIPLRIQFGFDSADLTDSSKKELDVFGAALGGEALAGRPFTIAGHTDNIGAEDYNMYLSEERAKAVVAYLVQEHGIVASTLTSAAFGESQPRRDNSTEEGRRENRRVEFIGR